MKAAKGFAIFLTIAAVPATIVFAQRSNRSGDDGPITAGELGYVSGDGIVLRPHPAFSQAAREISGDAEKSYSKWRTCMSGNDLGMAFKLHDRAAYARYRRYPAQFCGPEPSGSSADRAESFQLREAVYSISQGRRLGGVLATFSFTTGGEEIVRDSERLAGRCMVLTDSSGEPIPVRSLREQDPYAFSNPYRKAADPVARYQGEAQQLSDQLASNRSRLALLQEQLAGSRAWRGRQCVRPAAGAVPPRPAAMSDAAITAAAKGFCTDMSMRRLPKASVIAALRSNYMDSYIAAQSAWERGAKPQCAINIRSQVDDQMTLMMSRYGPTMGGYGMIQADIQKCEAIARNSCGAPLAAWQSQVQAIRAGPEAELNQCQGLVSQISSTRANIANGEPQLQQAMSNLETARATPQQGPQSLPLSKARCGSGS